MAGARREIRWSLGLGDARLRARPAHRPGRAWTLGASRSKLHNLGLLFVFKYADFAMRTSQPIFGKLPRLGLFLPLGISFIVFEKITYLVDIRRKTGRSPEPVGLSPVRLPVSENAGRAIVKYREIAPA